MITRPNLSDEKIIGCLREEYNLEVVSVAFLPLGADSNTAAFQVTTTENKSYFLKLRLGNFEEVSVSIPKLLIDQSVDHIIPPIETKTNQLCLERESLYWILYPFIKGKNAVEAKLTSDQWFEFGTTMRKIHHTAVPEPLRSNLKQEKFDPKYRTMIEATLERIKNESFTDPIALQLIDFLHTKEAKIRDIVARTNQLGLNLKTQPLDFVLCHTDIHAHNMLLETNGEMYIVDWDNPLFAPKERDLMFIDGGNSPWGSEEEVQRFYQGYGVTEVNQEALEYYRLEWIVEDVALFAEDILSGIQSDEDRKQDLIYRMQNFTSSS